MALFKCPPAPGSAGSANLRREPLAWWVTWSLFLHDEAEDLGLNVPPLCANLCPICRYVGWHGKKKRNWCTLKENAVDWHRYASYVFEGFFSKSPPFLWPLPVCHYYICVLCGPRRHSPPNGFNPDCKDVRLKIIFRDICGLQVYCVASRAVNIHL